MTNTERYAQLKDHIRQEIDAARAYLTVATTLSETLDHVSDADAFVDINEQAMVKATTMQALFDGRGALVADAGLADISEALREDEALDSLERARIALVEQARTVNAQNAVVVSALMAQAKEKMEALQRAARQTDTYTPSGQAQSQGSRTLASA